MRDGTNNSAPIVNLTLPTEASALATFFPPGMLWVKASIAAHVEGVCELVSVAANAVEVERRAAGGAALPKGTISKLKTPLAPVKGISQPFASFGGAAPEAADAFNTRVAERLRHRNRCITAWDYERSVLQAFPEVRKAKCIPHCANRGSGSTRATSRSSWCPTCATERGRPAAAQGRCRHARAHPPAPRGALADGHRHPPAQPELRVRLDFKVRFRAGVVEFLPRARAQPALVDHLSPWVRSRPRHAFGGGLQVC